MTRLTLTIRLSILLASLAFPLFSLALQAPEIYQQTTGPFEQKVNSQLALSVSVIADPEPTFQWQLNGKAIPDAVGYEYRQPAVQLAHGGTYTCVVKNSRGTKTTKPISVTVTDAAASEQPIYLSKDSTLTARVANGSGIAVWRKDGVILQNGAHYKDTTTSAIKIMATTEADLGIYTCEITTATGTLSPGPVHTVPVSDLPVVVDPEWAGLTNLRVGYQFTGDLEAEHYPGKFTITGLPPGLTANAMTGEVSGRFTKPGNYTVKISASNAHGTCPTLLLPMMVSPIAAEYAGNFVGTVPREESNQYLGGLVTVTITPAGSYSIKARSGTRTYSFVGKLQADAPDYAVSSIAWSGSGASAVSAHLTTGSPWGLQWMVSVSQGSPYDNQHLFTSHLAQCVTTAPPSVVGYHTLELNSSDVSGSGYATGTVSAKAVANLSLRLPDGTAVTMGDNLTADGSLICQKLLYGNTGGLEISLRMPENDWDRGLLNWFKKAPARPGRLLPDGFDTSIEASGYVWDVGDKSATSRVKEATVDLSGTVEDTFNVNAGRGAGFHSYDYEGNPSRILAFSLNATTGVFTGSVKAGYLTETRAGVPRLVFATLPFQGVVIPSGYDQVSGSGYYLLPDPPDPFSDPPTTLANSLINPSSVTFTGSPYRGDDSPWLRQEPARSPSMHPGASAAKPSSSSPAPAQP